MDIISIIIGALMLWYAVRGKGRIYENDNLKEGKQEIYLKSMRIMLAITGLLMIVPTVLGMLSVIPRGGVIDWIFMAGVLVMVVVLLVFSYKMTNKPKSKEERMRMAQEQYRDKIRPAFEFDDEDAGDKQDQNQQ